jgi:hypothetical protein
MPWYYPLIIIAVYQTGYWITEWALNKWWP